MKELEDIQKKMKEIVSSLNEDEKREFKKLGLLMMMKMAESEKYIEYLKLVMQLIDFELRTGS